MASVRDFLETIWHGHAPAVSHVRLADGRSFHGDGSLIGTGGTTTPGGGYFQVAVNSMALDHPRKGAKSYDPVVLAVTEFMYDGEVRRVPFVVSAAMVQADHGVPMAMRFADTTIAGPQPYNGSLAVTIILYKVLREDYSRRVLAAVSKTCASIDLTTALLPSLKIAEAVLDGLDAAFGATDTSPVLGHRLQFPAELTFGGFAILSSPARDGQLWLDGGDVKSGATREVAVPLDGVNRIAYSVTAADPIDLVTLPWFRPLWARIVQWANIPNEDAKAIAKHYLAALFEEVIASPDVARDLADGVYGKWEARARQIRERAENLEKWSAADIEADPVLARALAIARTP